MFESHVSPVFGFLLSRCGSRAVAEDLTAETFLAASNHFANGKGSEVSVAWLHTVARRRLVDHWRKVGAQNRRFKKLASELRVVELVPDLPDEEIDRALESLPDRRRAALVLRYMDDFSTSEVARSLGVSYKAAESLLSRARRSFAEAYQGDVTDE